MREKKVEQLLEKEEERAERSLPEDGNEALREAAKNLTMTMENMRIAEYVQYLNRPGKLLWTNFLIGVARGLGSTIGLAIVLMIAVYVLQKLITLNLPFLSDWLSKLIFSIQENLEYLNAMGVR